MIPEPIRLFDGHDSRRMYLYSHELVILNQNRISLTDFVIT